MTNWVVQDLIRACSNLTREAFAKELGGPILIAESEQTGPSFVRGGTTLKRDPSKPRFHRDKLLSNHTLPVFPVIQRLPGHQGQVTFGRVRENDIVMSDQTVSSRHAAFRQNPKTGTYALLDLGSSNGTWVNGQRLVAGRAITLFDGDVLIFGDCKFLFFYPDGLYASLSAALSRSGQ